jgi:hypothetical protein
VDVLEGNGPWVIGIKGNASSSIAGMFAAITLNDEPFTATGVSNTLFKATSNTVQKDWLNPNYDEPDWASGIALKTSDCKSLQEFWGDLLIALREKSPNQEVGASWLPNCSSASNEVYFRVIIPKNNGRYPPVTYPLFNTPTQITRQNIGYVNIPANFSFSFELNPRGIIPEWGSIIHFTNNGQNTSRLPGIWFHPGTNDLHIRFSGSGYWNEGFNNIKIPPGVTSQIRINAAGYHVEILIALKPQFYLRKEQLARRFFIFPIHGINLPMP